VATAPKSRSERLKFIIFSLIGVFNTVFDLVLYVLFLNATKSIIIANLISTSAALIGSYVLNSKVTFRTKKWTARSFILFIGVTVFGLWVLQTGAIYLFNHLLFYVPEHSWRLLGPIEHLAKSLLPKILATGITFVWNYLWYSRVIFKHDGRATQVEQALTEL
jgi:putative flippase GtrA